MKDHGHHCWRRGRGSSLASPEAALRTEWDEDASAVGVIVFRLSYLNARTSNTLFLPRDRQNQRSWFLRLENCPCGWTCVYLKSGFLEYWNSRLLQLSFRLSLFSFCLRCSPPRQAPTPSCARAQRRAAGRGREGRAGVRPCVRPRQRARRRERARGKRWLWPGRLGFLGLCSWARRLGVLLRRPRRVPAGSRRSGETPALTPASAPSTAAPSRPPAGASRPSSPEGGGEAILSRPTPRNREQRLGEAAEPRSPPSEAPDAATVGASRPRPLGGRPRPRQPAAFPRLPRPPA